MTSIEYGKYVRVVTELSGLITTNLGIPGGNMTSDILNAIKASPSCGVDLVTVEGGVNDWANNIPLGEFGDTEPATYYGALYQAFEYLTKCTDSRVVSITMHGDRSFESVLGGFMVGKYQRRPYDTIQRSFERDVRDLFRTMHSCC